jgi:iron complex outermembrane receptor protein
MKAQFNNHALALAIAVAIGSPTVLAQENTVDDDNLEKISILGSRVANRSATESSVPIDIIDAKSLTKGGFTELGQSLQATAPSFNFTRTQVSDGSDLFRPATLRGLQPDQTLVLVNGKRRHNQAIFGLNGTVGAGAAGTDMNAIPISALGNIQVLRDGAAAQYGSDAIAGVINLTLNESTGITTGFIQAGSTTEGDGDKMTLGLNRGFDLGDDGGFINLSFEYRDYDGVNRAERDKTGSSTIAPGELSDTVRWGQGDAASEFVSTFYNMALPLSGDKELYSFGGFSNRTALGNGFFRAFNSAAQNVPQAYPDGFLPRIDNEAEDVSLAVGVRGDVNNDWTFDASIVHGRNKYDFNSLNTINASYAAEYLANNPGASDADIASNSGPTSGYSGGFRFDQTTLNLDFSGLVELDTHEIYVSFGAEYRDEGYEIVPGEEASYACGTANSSSSFPSIIDPEVFAGCGFQAYPGLRPDAAVDADRNSYAVYLDLEMDITEKWNIGTAFRYEDFSDSGDDLVGKLSSRYEVSDSFAIRGAVSTGFRAPSLQQSAYTAFTTNLGPGGVLSPSFTATAGSPFPSALGVDGLELETTQNASIGFVFNATNELSITVDAYRVEIEDRITLGSLLSPDQVAFQPSAVAALAATGADQANYFSNSVDSTTQGVDIIVSYNTTLADGEFSATLAGNINDTEIDRVNSPAGIPKEVSLDALQRSFLEDGQPKERGTLTLDYQGENWSAILRANYFGETNVTYFGNDHIGLPGFLSPTGEFKATSVVESAVLVDLNLAYQLTENFELVAGVDNIFDVTPDELGEDEALDFITQGAFKYPIRAVPYGFNGASYFVRVNFSF